MATSYTQFKTELYEEHIEEASFLYDQKLAFLVDPEISWVDIDDEEGRLAAHIDALLIGEDLALKTLLRILEDGEPGVIYTAACLYCFKQDLRGFFSLFTKVDLTSADAIKALSLALMEYCPTDWLSSLTNNNFVRQAELLPIFLPFFAYQRITVPETWCDIALQLPLEDKAPLIYACGLLANSTSSTRNIIAGYIRQSENCEEQKAAITALFLQGCPQTFDYTFSHVPFGELRWSALVLGCNEQQARKLAAIQVNEWTAEAVTAMGLLGQVEFVPTLIGLLANEELASAAARSLYILTGQYITEEVFIEEQWDEELLFEHELEAFKHGEMPKTVDGKPFGENIEQLSTDQATWSKWWQTHQSHFQSGLRYRLGHPLNSMLLVATLIQARADYALRQHSYFELVVRFNCKIPFSPLLTVVKQKQQIAALYEWAKGLSINTQ